LSIAGNFPMLLLAAALIGTGSAVFHPESSRVARMASGGRHGLAQSLFQVGGNAGSAIGPLLAAFGVLHRGPASSGWFSLAAMLAIVLLWNVGVWYKRNAAPAARSAAHGGTQTSALPARKVRLTIAILLVLIFSKYFYLASLTSYYTFYLIEKFHVPV